MHDDVLLDVLACTDMVSIKLRVVLTGVSKLLPRDAPGCVRIIPCSHKWYYISGHNFSSIPVIASRLKQAHYVATQKFCLWGGEKKNSNNNSSDVASVVPYGPTVIMPSSRPTKLKVQIHILGTTCMKKKFSFNCDERAKVKTNRKATVAAEQLYFYLYNLRAQSWKESGHRPY